ncbi:hypothetical protein I4U23_020159 [Adineta vaga]|nr:hypothetical protein I4U23_020159 [Adineta vaga]
MIVLLILSFKNVRHIRLVQRNRQRQVRLMTKKDFELLRCLLAQDVIYIIFTIGLNINAIYELIKNVQTNTPIELAIDGFIVKCTLFLHQIPYCASFFIFISVSKTFRLDVKRSMYKIIGKELLRTREESNCRRLGMKRATVELNVPVSTIDLQT